MVDMGSQFYNVIQSTKQVQEMLLLRSQGKSPNTIVSFPIHICRFAALSVVMHGRSEEYKPWHIFFVICAK